MVEPCSARAGTHAGWPQDARRRASRVPAHGCSNPHLSLVGLTGGAGGAAAAALGLGDLAEYDEEYEDSPTPDEGPGPRIDDARFHVSDEALGMDVGKGAAGKGLGKAVAKRH